MRDEYLTCVPTPDLITAEFLCHYLPFPQGLTKVGRGPPDQADWNHIPSQGTLGNITVPLPQRRKHRASNRLQAGVRSLKTRQSAIRKDPESLVPSVLERAFQAEGCSTLQSRAGSLPSPAAGFRNCPCQEIPKKGRTMKYSPRTATAGRLKIELRTAPIRGD